MDNSGDVVSLQDLCLLTVDNYLSPSNVWSIYKLVSYVHCKRIQRIVHSFICDNFMDISHTQQFLDLDEKEMLWLVDNEEIVASEAAVLDGLARWYKHSKQQRENALKRLFDRLHLSEIGRDVLWQVIKNYKLHKVMPNLRKYKVSRSLFRRHLVDVDDLIHEENLLNVVVVDPNLVPWSDVDGHREGWYVNYWMSFARKSSADTLWSDKIIIPNPEQVEQCCFSNVVSFSDKIFALGKMVLKGGKREDSDDPLITVCVDLHSQAITHCTPLTNARVYGDGVTVACGIYIFVLGAGWVPGAAGGKEVYRYDTVKDEWRKMASTNHPCFFVFFDQTVVSYKNRYLYVFRQEYSEKYDLYTNTWTVLTETDVWKNIDLLASKTAFTMNNYIYVFGGWVNYLFDPLLETWYTLSLSFEFGILCSPRECFSENLALLYDHDYMSPVDEYLQKVKKERFSVESNRICGLLTSFGYPSPQIIILNRKAYVSLKKRRETAHART